MRRSETAQAAHGVQDGRARSAEIARWETRAAPSGTRGTAGASSASTTRAAHDHVIGRPSHRMPSARSLAPPVRRELYEQMMLTRVFETEAERPYKAARIGGYCHLSSGQEATARDVGLREAQVVDRHSRADERTTRRSSASVGR
jgi:hypothetical protein